jgi:hypothetical protein
MTPDGVRLHRSFRGSVDVNPRFAGGLLMVGAGPVELSIAEHDAAHGKNRTLQFRDSLGIGSRRQLPSDALRQDFWGPAAPRGLNQIRISLSSNASVAV